MQQDAIDKLHMAQAHLYDAKCYLEEVRDDPDFSWEIRGFQEAAVMIYAEIEDMLPEEWIERREAIRLAESGV